MIGQTMTAKELLDRLSHLDGTLPGLTDEQRKEAEKKEKDKILTKKA